MRTLVVVVWVLGCTGKGASSAKDVQSDVQNLRVAVDQWKAVRMGATQCPTIADLQKDKLLAPDQRTSDPWGHPYEIVCTPTDYVVRSAGPDGIPGNADDIVAGTK
ncbi:MAG: hypothetical protein ACXWUG_17310 [Polyangiales bacterium]